MPNRPIVTDVIDVIDNRVFREPDRNKEKSHTIADLARRVARLSHSHSNPELFHIEKDEIVKTLRRIARG